MNDAAFRHRWRYADDGGRIYAGTCPAAVGRLEGYSLVGRARAVAYSERSRCLAVLGSDVKGGSVLAVWDVGTPAAAPLWTRDDAMAELYWLACDDSFVFATAAALVKVDAASGARYAVSVPFSSFTHSVDFGPRGAPLADHMLVVGSCIGRVTMYSPMFEPLWRQDLRERASSLFSRSCFSVTGAHCRVVMQYFNFETLLDAATGRVMRRVQRSTSCLYGTKITTDCQLADGADHSDINSWVDGNPVQFLERLRDPTICPVDAPGWAVHASGSAVAAVTLAAVAYSPICLRERLTLFDLAVQPVCGWVEPVPSCALNEYADAVRAIAAIDEHADDNDGLGLVRAVLEAFIAEDARLIALKLAF